ncbi:MAG: AAA family ATPase [Legionellaceae bacterium]|nr:AAA family ATPase [Legionellaceae bacterium]
MKRIVDQNLKDWKASTHRKPLMLRGARQVGKTTAVRNLGESFLHFIEINFEAAVAWRALFEKNLDTQQLVIDLELMTEQKIIPGKTLLFFDEIQACPQAMLALRYFYEQLPELHVIAAGSLLDFAIEELTLRTGRLNKSYYLTPA